MKKPVVTILCRTGGESQKRKFPLDYPPGIWYYIRCIQYAPVAQLDRASDSDSEGRAFEPHRAYQSRHGFHGGIFCVKAISGKTVQDRFPHKRTFYLLQDGRLYLQNQETDRKKALRIFRGCFLNLCRRRHTAALHSSLFTIHLLPTPLPFIMTDIIKEGASPW